jgi:hypothetical protein
MKPHVNEAPSYVPIFLSDSENSDEDSTNDISNVSDGSDDSENEACGN